jgi:integrase
LEEPLGVIADRLLIEHGIGKIDAPSRLRLLEDLALALRDAFRVLRRNAEGDYSADPAAARFPQYVPSRINGGGAGVVAARSQTGTSLKGLVESWWVEASSTGRKPSTRESYTNTMTAFVAFLGHDDAGRVTRDDVVGFKDHRLASVNPRNGKRVSAKTVKDSDLAGLKTIFGWAVTNGKMDLNPAEGVTIKLGRSQKLRSKAFSDSEAEAVLKASQSLQQGRERPKTFAAKQWVPWLCAYTGARVGELAQLRKEDIRREGSHWIANINP